MARSNVPPFGDWDSEDVSYTTYFENARKPSSTEKANPNSFSESPNSKQETVRRSAAARAKHQRKVSQDEGELRRQFDGGNKASRDSNHQRKVSQDEGELRRQFDGGNKAYRDSNHQQSVGSTTPKRAPRPNGGGVRSADQSPMHPRYQAKIASKGSSMSPSWEKRGSSEGTHGLAPSTPGRSRLRSVPRGNGTPERGTAVPKFGEWDETDPSSADGFSHIFSKVKEERHGSVGDKLDGTKTQRSNGQKRYKSKDSKGCGCFPW